jgi:hypothetical protein
MHINKINKMMVIVTIVSSFGLLSSAVVNSAFSAAVPVPKPHTGNSDLDKGFPKFFHCLNSAIKSNADVKGIKSYFTHEPTRNEMKDCFNNSFSSSA